MGTLRIHFTSADLAGIQVAREPDPLIELTLSLSELRKPSPGWRFTDWRSALSGRLHQRVLPLMDLVPSAICLPEFLDPTAAESAATGPVAAAALVPRQAVRDYLTMLGHHQPLSWATRQFADADAARMRAMGMAVASYHDTAIAPYWHQIRSAIDTDRALRASTFLDGGIDQLLSALHHRITWRAPVLSVRLRTERDFDLRLAGSGLRLQPSLFAGSGPVVWEHQTAGQAPTLVYPAQRDLVARRGAGTASLAALIGRARTNLLTAIAESPGIQTGALARRLALSPATASEHATVLRNAGLITTVRSGRSALHTVTASGAALLSQATTLQ